MEEDHNEKCGGLRSLGRNWPKLRSLRLQHPESIRQNSIFKDYFLLADAPTKKRKYLYLLGTEQALAFSMAAERSQTCLAAATRCRSYSTNALASDMRKSVIISGLINMKLISSRIKMAS
jgi:hypothetical protein